MYSQIRILVLNPEWNIPYDIIKNEYYHKLVRSNTAVVNREHLYIRDSRTGKYVVPDSINWSKVSQGNIPYRLHQTSGRYNALGLYKFVFANSESVYLHDTNNKGAFKRRKRALSHGCVRVQHPDSVAEWIYTVNGFDTIYTEQLHITSGAEPTTEKGEEFVEKLHEKDSIYYEKLSDWDKQFYRKLRPTSVALRKPIPLFIEYYTCFVGDDGTILPGDVVVHDYLCITTDEIMRDHTAIEPTNLPVCTSTAYDYYRLEGTYLDGFSALALRDLIGQASERGETTLRFKLSSQEAYDEAFAFVSSQEVFRCFDEPVDGIAIANQDELRILAIDWAPEELG
jgi:hypothetical protein